MMNFINSIQSVLNNQKVATENGALGYRTTGHELLDLNFSVASLRRHNEEEIAVRFVKAYFESPVLAVKWLFFARDARGGLGERRLFRVAMRALVEVNKDVARAVLGLVPEYGRYDDLWSLIGTELEGDVISLVRDQLASDKQAMDKGEPVSLLAKWMPSENTSSPKTKALARTLRCALGMSSVSYRKLLSAMRKHIDVVERKMSAGEWSKISYEAVPSRANLVYSSAFLRNDEKRRTAYLDSVARGESKINAGVLFPHDIVHKYCGSSYSIYGCHDEALEELWKALPDLVNGDASTLVVADGSGSMCTRVDPSSSVTALNVANALAIYFAERSSGAFKDKYITFSSRPQLVDLGKMNSLREKLIVALAHDECSNTNIEATFNLILEAAVANKLSQEDMPKNILIISDMEFDHATCGNVNDTLFESIAKRYEEHGYALPRLVFWNVASRCGAIPVKENALGVALVSGFSVNVVKMVMSGELDPYQCLVSTLEAPRYQAVSDALLGVIAQ